MPGSLAGRVAVVTGGNGGIGFWTCLRLARHGAKVVLACRSPERADGALRELRNLEPAADLEVVQLDLANLASIHEAAAEIRDRHYRLDLLINNAGVVGLPLNRTVNGLETHLAANFIGHFALTGLLLDLVQVTEGGRVVSVGSLAQRVARIDLDDLNFDNRKFSKRAAYGQSKLANVMFMLELDRRLARNEAGRTGRTISVGAHPGAALTNIADDLRAWRIPRLREATQYVVDRTLNTPELSAEPIVAAATRPGLPGGSYLGPGGRGEIKGSPAPAKLSHRSQSTANAARLWAAAEELSAVSYLNG